MAKYIFVFLLFIFSVSTFGCSDNSKNNKSDIQNTKQEISEILDQTWDALSVQDLELFNQYTLEGWHLYTARGNKMDAETLFRSHRENMMDFSLEYSNLRVSVHRSVAWATYDAHMSGLRQGEEWEGDFIFTNVFIREDGKWKIAHMHESLVQ